MLLGGGVGAIVPITYNSSRISFSFLPEQNQIFQLFLFMGKAQELFILKQVLNFSWSECSFVHFEFKGGMGSHRKLDEFRPLPPLALSRWGHANQKGHNHPDP